MKNKFTLMLLVLILNVLTLTCWAESEITHTYYFIHYFDAKGLNSTATDYEYALCDYDSNSTNFIRSIYYNTIFKYNIGRFHLFSTPDLYDKTTYSAGFDECNDIEFEFYFNGERAEIRFNNNNDLNNASSVVEIRLDENLVGMYDLRGKSDLIVQTPIVSYGNHVLKVKMNNPDATDYGYAGGWINYIRYYEHYNIKPSVNITNPNNNFWTS